MKIYVFGNPLVKDDSVALAIANILRPRFPEIVFESCDPNESFPPDDEKNVIVLDVVKGINKAILLDYSDLALVEKSPVSPHDYDLLLHLLLLRKMGRLKEVRIIGLPYGVDAKNLLSSVVKIISSLL